MDLTFDMPDSGLTPQEDDLFTDLLPEELLEKYSHFSEITRSNLLTILHDNENTEVGVSLGFSSMNSEDKFRKGVALSKYTDYRDFIECMQMGDEDLLTSYKLYSFLKTSGTEGDEKIIPLTETALSRYKNYIDTPCAKILERCGGKRFMVSMLRADLSNPQTKLKNILLSGAYYSYQYSHGLLDIDQFAGKEPLTFFHRNCDFFFAKVWLAFVTEDITTMESIFMYDILLFFRYMEKHFSEIIECMESGHIPLSVNLPLNAKNALLSLPVDKKRLQKIKDECEKGFDDIVSRLWPHIKVISGIGSDIYSHEEYVLKKYTGDIPLWYFSYVVSECHIGIAMHPGSKEYLLLPDSAYYEFLPEEHTIEPEKWVKRSSEAEIGQNYELVLTTFNGLYRYMLGDIVKVTGFYGEAPIIRFLYRRNQVLNIAGEKINEKALTSAVNYTLKFYRHDAIEYFVLTNYNETPAHYEAFFSSEKKLDEIDIAYFSRILDTTLRQESFAYGDLRSLNMVAPIKVNWLTPEDYDNVRINTDGQSKPIHIVVEPDQDKLQLLLNNDF